MLSFRQYIKEAMATPNTVLADINEIHVGYILAGNKWFDSDAKKQFNARVKQAQPDEVADAMGKADAMAVEFLKWSKKKGYSGRVKDVWWTARPNSMSKAVGYPVDQRKNPTDVLILFTGPGKTAFLGLSAKATKGKGDIGFKNPGIGTVDKSLNLKMQDVFKKAEAKTIEKFTLPKGSKDRKKFIRDNKGIQQHTIQIGIELMSGLRDTLLIRMKKMKQPELLAYLLSDWMDAEVNSPPYIKVTGMGNKPPYTAAVVDPLSNDKLSALGSQIIKLEAVGNESIGVIAGKKKIMKIRFKFESEKMASSMKLSGDPWK
tara:strand:- start:1210 stop:2160 length:951 start_codon:yes stop_codon:yes gene_type:complete